MSKNVLQLCPKSTCKKHAFDKYYVIIHADDPGNITVSSNMSSAEVALIDDQTYTGNALKPKVTVTLDGKELKEEVHYNLSYKSNVNVGRATVTIKGIGDIKGKKTIRFNIVQNDISVSNDDSKVNVLVDGAFYRGKPVRPKVKVYAAGKKVSAGNYSLSYTNNTSAGTGYVTVSAKPRCRNFTGSKTVSFNITDNKAYNITNCKTGSITSKTYDGSAKEMDYLFIFDSEGTLLTRNVNYTVDYMNNVNAGTGLLIVNGIGKYVGTKIFSFKINRDTIDNTDICAVSSNVSLFYDGNSKCPGIIVLRNDNGKQLRVGTDYKIKYVNCDKAGNASIKVCGIGNYAGTQQRSFYIQTYDWDELSVSSNNIRQTGNKYDASIQFSLDGRSVNMRRNKAYSVKIKTDPESGRLKITISGLGAYKRESKKIIYADL